MKIKKKAWLWDKEILLKEYEKSPEDIRVVFYLAQTFACLGEKENAIALYKKRVTMGGFHEEIFESFMRLANLSDSWDDKLIYYHKAFQVINRAEPMVQLASYYRSQNNHILAFTYAYIACKLLWPSDCHLFIDKSCYDYTRWFELGISAYYVQEFKLGELACRNALKTQYDKELNEKNLSWYTDKLQSEFCLNGEEN